MADGGRYDGEWRNGDRNGRGVLIYSDGCRYDGEWKDDKPCYQWLQPFAIGFVIVCMLIYWLRRSTAPPANDNVARLADALRRVADAHASRRVATDDQINQLPFHTMTQIEIDSDGLIRKGSSDSSGANPPPCCSICIVPYEVGDELRSLLCAHKFHKDCINQWLRTLAVRPLCPLCKADAVEISIAVEG